MFLILKFKLDPKLFNSMQRVRDLPSFPKGAHLGEEMKGGGGNIPSSMEESALGIKSDV